MLYLNKLISKINENPAIFKEQDVIMRFGLTNTQIKDLKKYALENQLITQSKNEYFLTEAGLKYLDENPLQAISTKGFTLCPSLNVEYLKEEKMPSVLTRAIRLLAKHFLQEEQLKENSLEKSLLIEIKNNEKLISKMEQDILSGKRMFLESIYEKYASKGFTRSLFFLFLLDILSRNLERVAIYEKSMFQLKFDPLMFDRMVACPQNFEIQKTEMEDEYILKDISKIILNKKSNNILEITKGLYLIIKSLDKYTMNTQNLSKKTLRFRNLVINAKDPLSLFGVDIPKIFGYKSLGDCDRKFLNDFKNSLDELKNCVANLVKNIKIFFFQEFRCTSKELLAERFNLMVDFLNEKDLRVLFNTVIETNVSEDLWINRVATFINKYRVPKDWSDEDYADFKIKTKELALKFFALESLAGENGVPVSDACVKVLEGFCELSRPEQITVLRKAINV